MRYFHNHFNNYFNKLELLESVKCKCVERYELYVLMDNRIF